MLSWLNLTSVVKVKASAESPQKLRMFTSAAVLLDICDFLLFMLTWPFLGFFFLFVSSNEIIAPKIMAAYAAKGSEKNIFWNNNSVSQEEDASPQRRSFTASRLVFITDKCLVDY